MKAVNLFNQWALKGRDSGMAKNHMPAVKKMLSLLFQNQTTKFSFIDIGCGNGYVIREISRNPLCSKAIGIDGSKEMIKKAKLIHPEGQYVCSDITIWCPIEKFDFIHSMEVLYYLKNPKKSVKNIVNNWLKKNGEMIMGIDFYYENKDCHSWPDKLNVPMKLFSINQWKDIFKEAGLSNIKFYQVNKKGNFSGTLIMSGINC